MATIFGTLDADSLPGGSGNDSIYGGPSATNTPADFGNDTLSGLGGNDLILGFGGDDLLSGDAGNDVIRGGSGNDLIYGGAGDDRLYGDAGDDTIEGGLGNDTFNPLEGFDYVSYAFATGSVTVNLAFASATGSAGTDTLVKEGVNRFEGIIGSGFADTLTGDEISNRIYAGAGNDWVNGDDGGDLLFGEDGDDILIGGNGDDTLDGGAAGNDQFYGGNGFDRASFASAVAGVTVDLNNTGSQNTGGAGSDLLFGIEHLTGSAFNDVLTGDGASNRLEGGDGNDALAGGAGNDSLLGGAGLDTLTGGAGNDYYNLSDISLTSIFPLKYARDIVIEDPGGGIDHIVVTRAATRTGAGTFYVLPANVENGTIGGGKGDDFALALYGNELDNLLNGNIDSTIDGGLGNDTIYGGNGPNLLIGGEGNDVINGRGSNSTLIGGAGNDAFSGYGGKETVDYGTASGAVTVSLALEGPQDTGGEGIDTFLRHPFEQKFVIDNLAGSDFNDRLSGDANANLLIGRAGNDTLTGGAGGDTMQGGAGDDVYQVDTLADVVEELAGDGYDTVRSSVTLTLAENVERLLLTGKGVIDGTGNGLANRIVGNAATNTLNGLGGGDTLLGGVGNDILRGAAGNDVLFGGADNDTLTGGAGHDTLNGGADNDVLAGLLGRDVLTGGGGLDRFDFNALAETGTSAKTRDVITDFTKLFDRIDLSDIDARTGGGDDAFTFIGKQAFSGAAGELRYAGITTGIVVAGDVDGDGKADFQIELATPGLLLAAKDFIL